MCVFMQETALVNAPVTLLGKCQVDRGGDRGQPYIDSDRKHCFNCKLLVMPFYEGLLSYVPKFPRGALIYYWHLVEDAQYKSPCVEGCRRRDDASQSSLHLFNI